MKARTLALALSLAPCLFVLSVLLVLAPQPAQAQATVRYVATTGLDAGACTNPAGPCRTVQYAVDAASPGDVVKIAAGLYSGVHSHAAPPGYQGPATIFQAVYLDKAVTLRGGYLAPAYAEPPDPVAHPTRLDAAGQGRVLFVHGPIAPRAEGLVLVNGSAAGLGGVRGAWDDAGGLYVVDATLTMRHSQVLSSTATVGGGAVWVGGGGLFEESTIAANTASCSGGLALFDSALTVRANTLRDNRATSGNCYGGGISVVDGSALVEDNLISGNRAYGGGGLALDGPITVRGNTIADNTAWAWGGGAHLCGDALLDANVFAGNSGGSEGGGGLSIVCGAPVLTNNAIVDNDVPAGARGSGIAVIASHPRLLHSTVARNAGGDGSGIAVKHFYWGGPDATLALTNTILVDHPVGIGVDGGNTLAVDGILWHNTPLHVSAEPTATVSLLHERTGDPVFAADGYHLSFGSAAVDSALPAGAGHDLDGQPRPMGAGYDLGADELTPHLLLSPDAAATLVYTDVQGNPSLVDLPAGAVTTTTLLVYTPLDAAAAPPDLYFARHAFELDAYREGALLPDFAFELPVDLAVHYSQADLVGVDEPSLSLLSWTGAAWLDAACGSYVRDLDQNWLAAPICHITPFALFGGRGPAVYLPLVLRDGG